MIVTGGMTQGRDTAVRRATGALALALLSDPALTAALILTLSLGRSQPPNWEMRFSRSVRNVAGVEPHLIGRLIPPGVLRRRAALNGVVAPQAADVVQRGAQEGVIPRHAEQVDALHSLGTNCRRTQRYGC